MFQECLSSNNLILDVFIYVVFVFALIYLFAIYFSAIL